MPEPKDGGAKLRVMKPSGQRSATEELSGGGIGSGLPFHAVTPTLVRNVDEGRDCNKTSCRHGENDSSKRS